MPDQPDPRVDTVARILHEQRERRTEHLPNYVRVKWADAPEHVRDAMREAAREIVGALDSANSTIQQEESPCPPQR